MFLTCWADLDWHILSRGYKYVMNLYYNNYWFLHDKFYSKSLKIGEPKTQKTVSFNIVSIFIAIFLEVIYFLLLRTTNQSFLKFGITLHVSMLYHLMHFVINCSSTVYQILVAGISLLNNSSQYICFCLSTV